MSWRGMSGRLKWYGVRQQIFFPFYIILMVYVAWFSKGVHSISFISVGETYLDLRFHGHRCEISLHRWRGGEEVWRKCEDDDKWIGENSDEGVCVILFHFCCFAVKLQDRHELKSSWLFMKETGVQFPLGVADRLCAYARSVGHFPTALKEYKVKQTSTDYYLQWAASAASLAMIASYGSTNTFLSICKWLFQWRNGWFADITAAAREKSLPDPSPYHSAVVAPLYVKVTQLVLTWKRIVCSFIFWSFFF